MQRDGSRMLSDVLGSFKPGSSDSGLAGAFSAQDPAEGAGGGAAAASGVQPVSPGDLDGNPLAA